MSSPAPSPVETFSDSLLVRFFCLAGPPPAETRSDSLLVFFICLAFPPATEMSHVDKKFKQFEDPIITMVVVANSVALHLQIQSKKTQSLKPNSLNTCHQLTATTL
mmetsp:Transcript_4649/g.10286  ORF Transcript_4649/g.10286 Transcript_4649/m.10286 type:complete len:106 (-) Transcript_4649:31-348(-)